MSNTNRGSKGPGYDFGSRRPGIGGYGKHVKKFTKRRERNKSKQLLRNAPEALRQKEGFGTT